MTTKQDLINYLINEKPTKAGNYLLPINNKRSSNYYKNAIKVLTNLK